MRTIRPENAAKARRRDQSATIFAVCAFVIAAWLAAKFVQQVLA